MVDEVSKPKLIIRNVTQRYGFSYPTATAQDGKRLPGGLSFEARGLLAYLLSKPDDWIIIPADIQAEGGIGRDKASGILKELRDAGYIVTEMVKDENNHFVGKVDRIFEVSQPAFRHTEIPYDGSPVSRKNRNIHNIDSKQKIDSTEKEKELRGAKRPASVPAPRLSYGEMHPELSEAELDAQAAELAKVDPARPASDVVEVIAPRAKAEPIYDAWERVRGLRNNPLVPRDFQDRNGWIVRWLKGEVGNWRKSKLGRIDAPATVADVEAFGPWYQNQYPGIRLPIDPVKFVGHWRTFIAGRAAVSSASTATPAPSAELAKLTAEAVELGRRGILPDDSFIGGHIQRLREMGASLPEDPILRAYYSGFGEWRRGQKS